ncbi:MAG TPA: hypothetical protein VFA20_26750 [Myxococcaceae bacterium]|nr:hypothetical protein [Myxococcaceae bacterium]
MSTLPPLLETYEDARLLFVAKGWGVRQVQQHLSELAELARFRLTHTRLCQYTKAGANKRIEPEVAAAMEGLPTWHGYERQTEIVTKGLLALHGDPSVDVGPVAAELPGELAQALERKARLPKLSRAARRRISIAGSGAVVGCFAALVVPVLPFHLGAVQPEPPMLIVTGPGPDGATVGLDPRVLVDRPMSWGEKPFENQPIPKFLLPGQKAPPCDASDRQEAIQAGCWIEIAGKPPCGHYFRHGDKCYAPVAAPKKP